MKIRKGFVSNSSSSSFIVPDAGVPEALDYSSLRPFFNPDEFAWDYEGNLRKMHIITLPIIEGKRYFGWANTRYTSFADKLNYLFLQIQSLYQNVRLKNKLEHALEKALKSICEKAYNLKKLKYGEFAVKVDYNHLLPCTSIFESIYDFKDIYYIDHQSTWGLWEQDVANYFECNEPNADLIEKYLVGRSYIQGGNDNDDMTPEYHDSLEIFRTFIKNRCPSSSQQL